MNLPDRLPVRPLGSPPDAEVALPGSKSITNRALVCAALAPGTSVLEGALRADDTEAMIDVARAVGADVRWVGPQLEVRGTAGQVAPGGGAEPRALQVRLSGTTARFGAALVGLAGTGRYLIDAAPPMRARPMADLVAALRALGAEAGGDALPLLLTAAPRGPGAPASVTLPGSTSSQFASGLLLAAPARPGGLEVEVAGRLVSRPYLDMTVAVMAAFGVVVGRVGAARFVVPEAAYAARRYPIEPDASAASYFLGAAAALGGRVRVPGLGRSSVQGDAAFADVLARMGAEVRWADGGVELRGTGGLRGTDVDLSDLSDTAPTLAVVASFASSPTRIRGIGFIRSKETDRVGNVVAELRRAGIRAEEEDDGMVVHPGPARPALIRTYDDHRMAMSFALLGLRWPGIEIDDPACVAKTFPGYFEALDRLRRPAGAGASR